ncbi:hypothetical protein VP01_1992g2, partial [Puccinia sorghi]
QPAARSQGNPGRGVGRVQYDGVDGGNFGIGPTGGAANGRIAPGGTGDSGGSGEPGRRGEAASPVCPAPPGQGCPAGICAYCGVKGHYWSQCAELTANLNAQRVRIWQGDFYFPGSREKIKGIPRDMVRAANPEGSSQTKPEATSASGVVVGAEWHPPVVGAEVRAVQSDKRKTRGKETAGCSVPAPGKKKAAELAKCALGGESQVALSLKELATVSPMMAEELISVIWERAGLKVDGNRIFFDMRSGEESGRTPPGEEGERRGDKGKAHPSKQGFKELANWSALAQLWMVADGVVVHLSFKHQI